MIEALKTWLLIFGAMLLAVAVLAFITVPLVMLSMDGHFVWAFLWLLASVTTVVTAQEHLR